MKNTFAVHRIFLILNLLLVAVLVYLVFIFVFKHTRQEYIVDSQSEPAQVNIKFSKDSSEAVNHNIILERNVFNPVKLDSFQGDSNKETDVNQAQKPLIHKQLELRLLGTVAGDKEIACAIIEDVKTKVQDLYKVGDVIQGASIEKIERNRIILLNEGIPEMLNLYLASEDVEDPIVLAKETKATISDRTTVEDVIKITSPTERQVNKNAFLTKIGGIEAILKTVEVTPYAVKGKSSGLQITGLEGLSMARFVGLENGDVIQTINGKILTDSRKAFQVLRKARALSTLDMELKRDSEKKTLSFKIE